MRLRRGEWIKAGAFAGLEEEALHAYDKIVGPETSDMSVDTSIQKIPCGGERTGKNSTDRAKLVCKWSILTDLNGVPVG